MTLAERLAAATREVLRLELNLEDNGRQIADLNEQQQVLGRALNAAKTEEAEAKRAWKQAMREDTV